MMAVMLFDKKNGQTLASGDDDNGNDDADERKFPNNINVNTKGVVEKRSS